MAKGKTKEFKERQCRYCELADKVKFGRGRPCCPLPNPRIRTGHCMDRKASKETYSEGRKVKARAREKSGNFWYVWVICPDCNKGRWVQESRAKALNFTGRCNQCRLKIAKREMTLYHPT